MKFVSAKVVEKPKIEIPIVEKMDIESKSKAKGKLLLKSQRGPQVKHFCHHCGIHGHTRPNCFKFHALKRANSQHAQGNERRMPRAKQAKKENGGQLIGDIMKMLKNISSCLTSFTPRIESYIGSTPPSKDFTQNTRAMWVKKGTHA